MSAPSRHGGGEELIDSWKDISAYLGVDVRSAKRYEKERGLPVWRQATGQSKVFSYRSALDAWREAQIVPPQAPAPVVLPEAPPPSPSPSRRRYRWRWVLGAVTAAAVLASVLMFRNPVVAPVVRRPMGRLLWRVTSEGFERKTFPLPDLLPGGVVTADGTALLLPNPAQPEVLKIDPRDGKIERLAVGVRAGPLVLTRDGRTLFIAVGRGGILRVDLTPPYRPETIEFNGAISDLLLAPDERAIFIAAAKDGVRRLDLNTRRLEVITRTAYAHRLSLSPDGRFLVVSYQGGRPPGHDPVEILDAKSGQLLNRIAGPPIVGGSTGFSPLDGNLWVAAQDACVNPSYDHVGCPAVPTGLIHIFRHTDYRLLDSWALGPTGGEPLFVGDGSRVASVGNLVSVLDATRLKLVEAWPERAGFLAFSPAGDRLYVQNGARAMYTIEAEPADCDAAPKGRDEFFAFDGTWEDAIDNSPFQPRGNVGFIPGLVGQAARLGADGEIRVRPSVANRFGRYGTSLVFWLKYSPGTGEARLFRREGPAGETLFRMTAAANGIRIEGPGVSLQSEIPFHAWTQIGVTCERNRLALFVNGKHQADGALREHFDLSTDDRFVLGGTGSGPFALDELMTFERAVSKEELGHLYALRTSGPCTP